MAVLSFDTVRKIALATPGVEDSTLYGSPALKLHGRAIACIPVDKSAEPNSAAFWIGVDRRAVLLASQPDAYYAPAHYLGYPIVLARLTRLASAELRELLALAFAFAASRPLPRRRAPRARARPPRRG
jgi:hypothetical protein